MSYRIERELQFDAAHRVKGHEGKCAHLHGHRYRVVFVLECKELDPVGRVVDFGFIKDEWGKWIDKNLDHGVLLSREDLPLSELLRKEDPEAKICVTECPVTAEGISQMLSAQFAGWLPVFVDLVEVRVWETPNCMGVYIDNGS